MRKWFAAILAALSIGLFPSPASAADEVISDFNVRLTLNSDSSLTVDEVIDYNFTTDRHGILRDIPRYDQLPGGNAQFYDIAIESVEQDGLPAEYTASNIDAYLELQIGNPDMTISGTHEYRIRYTIANAITLVTADAAAANPVLREGDVELYWDAIGAAWQVPVQQGQVTVLTPGPALFANCTFGPAGSTDVCTQTGDLTYSLPRSISTGEAMTVLVQVGAANFNNIATPDIRPLPMQTFSTALVLGLALGACLFVVVIVFALRGRRNPRFRPTESIRFDIPDNLRPAEMAVAWKGQFDARALLATFLDFSTRGAVTLEMDGKHLVVQPVSDAKLSDWERDIYRAVLASGSYRFDKYDRSVAGQVKQTQAQLREASINAGRLNPKSGRAKLKFILIGVAAFISIFISAVFIELAPWIAGLLMPAGFLTAIAGVAAAFIAPRIETESSAEFVSAVLGLRRAMDTDSAAARREFAQRSGLGAGAVFATMLPYAVVFELEEAWQGAFPDLTPDEYRNNGLYFLAGTSIHDTVRHSANSLASTLQTPGRSGSGGGGSSGGGGGGGGGGSW